MSNCSSLNSVSDLWAASRRISAAVLIALIAPFMSGEARAASTPALTCADLFQAPPASVPFEQSTSAKYLNLERSTVERTKWIRSENRKFNNDIKKSPNYKKVSAWMKDLYFKPTTTQRLRFSQDRELMIIQRGFGKAEEFVLRSGLQHTLLASSFAEKENGSRHFVEFKLSPDHTHVALIFEDNGALDRFQVKIFDLATQSEVPVRNGEIRPTDEDIYWIGTNVYFRRHGEQYQYSYKYPNKGVLKSDFEIFDQKDWLSLVWEDGFKMTEGKVSYPLPATQDLQPRAIIAKTENAVFLRLSGKDDLTVIKKLPYPLKLESMGGEDVFAIRNAVVQSVRLQTGHIFIQKHFGTKQTAQVITEDGILRAEIEIPLGLSISAMHLNPEKTKLDVTFVSNVVAGKSFVYDLALKKFEVRPEEIVNQMMTADGKKYVSTIVDVKSEDGTVLPVRITHLQEKARDGRGAVFMEVYGGFQHTVHFYPKYNEVRADFLARGGILVDPAIRGGNEFGRAWSQQATFADKEKTMQDLIATAQYLVKEKVTRAQDIVIWGASNGGMVVASAALTSPKDFGLVVAVNGVHDMIRKEFSDAPFNGWAYEYGDSRWKEFYPYIFNISPTELASKVKNPPKIILLNGRDDTRVRSVNSFKLTKALSEKYPDQVRLYSLPNSGHWNNSPDYQGIIGWRALSSLWSLMYDHWGWQR